MVAIQGSLSKAFMLKKPYTVSSEVVWSILWASNSCRGVGIPYAHAPRSHRTGESAPGVHALFSHLSHGCLCTRLLQRAAATWGSDAKWPGVPPSLQLHPPRSVVQYRRGRGSGGVISTKVRLGGGGVVGLHNIDANSPILELAIRPSLQSVLIPPHVSKGSSVPPGAEGQGASSSTAAGTSGQAQSSTTDATPSNH